MLLVDTACTRVKTIINENKLELYFSVFLIRPILHTKIAFQIVWEL